MEKLELKHLAPYLPYELKLKRFDGKISELEIGYNPTALLVNFKPILRPLSDLMNEINIKNDVFIPVEYFEIGDDDSGTEYDNGNIKTIEKLIYISKYNCFFDIHYLPFDLVQKLLEWHFDIYGLIDKGLAISYSDVQSTSNEG